MRSAKDTAATSCMAFSVKIVAIDILNFRFAGSAGVPPNAA
jgi:hypothetical protein